MKPKYTPTDTRTKTTKLAHYDSEISAIKALSALRSHKIPAYQVISRSGFDIFIDKRDKEFALRILPR